MWDLILLVGLGLVYCLVYMLAGMLRDARWAGTAGLLLAIGIVLTPAWGLAYTIVTASLEWIPSRLTDFSLLVVPPWIIAVFLAIRLRRRERLNRAFGLGFLGLVGFVLPFLYIARLISIPQVSHADLPGLCFIPAVGAGAFGLLAAAVRLLARKPVQ